MARRGHVGARSGGGLEWMENLLGMFLLFFNDFGGCLRF